jgi:hypothetical protein
MIHPARRDLNKKEISCEDDAARDDEAYRMTGRIEILAAQQPPNFTLSAY